MRTTASQPDSTQRWKCLFQAATREADAGTMADRIARAEDAIIERALELQRICQRGTELQDLTQALCSLGDVRRRKLFPHAFFAGHGNNSRAA
jgi:hypothetical protein